MTAADHEPICGPSCTPDCGMGHCYLTDGPYRDPAEHALRDKVRDTIHAANPTCIDYHAADCDLCAVQADAAMAAVQPSLDRLRARLDYWQRRASAHARAAETAEQRLAELREEARDE